MSTPEPQKRRRPRHSKAGQRQSDTSIAQPTEGATEPTSGHLPISQNQAPQTPAPKMPSRSKIPSEQQTATTPKREHSASNKKRRAKPHRNPEDGPASQHMPTVPTSIPTSNTTSISRPVSQNYAEYYAGPTFHNSPAPSSLPIPKMFLKSASKVPTVDGARSSSEGRSSESSSSVDENSPTQRKAGLPVEQRQREESPLDIFFQAAKKERAANIPPTAASDMTNVPGPFFRSEHNGRSPSPANRPTLQQQRLDGVPEPPQYFAQPSRISQNPTSSAGHFPFLGGDGAGDATLAPPDGFTSDLSPEDELQIKKSEELKKLFMSHSSTQKATSSSLSEVYGSVPAHSSPFRGFTSPTTSLMDRPVSASPNHTSPIPNNTEIRNHFNSPSRHSHGVKPTSSNLQNEAIQNNDPGFVTQLRPSTGQRPRINSEKSSSIYHNKQQILFNGSNPPSVSTHTPFSDPNTISSNSQGASGNSGYDRHSPMKSMEDDLRRLLKMETSGDRILDVRS